MGSRGGISSLTSLFLGRLQGVSIEGYGIAAAPSINGIHIDPEQAASIQSRNAQGRELGTDVGLQLTTVLIEDFHEEPLPHSAIESCEKWRRTSIA